LEMGAAMDALHLESSPSAKVPELGAAWKIGSGAYHGTSSR
jgi:hypothetical protein